MGLAKSFRQRRFRQEQSFFTQRQSIASSGEACRCVATIFCRRLTTESAAPLQQRLRCFERGAFLTGSVKLDPKCFARPNVCFSFFFAFQGLPARQPQAMHSICDDQRDQHPPSINHALALAICPDCVFTPRANQLQIKPATFTSDICCKSVVSIRKLSSRTVQRERTNLRKESSQLICPKSHGVALVLATTNTSDFKSWLRQLFLQTAVLHVQILHFPPPRFCSKLPGHIRILMCGGWGETNRTRAVGLVMTWIGTFSMGTSLWSERATHPRSQRPSPRETRFHDFSAS